MGELLRAFVLGNTAIVTNVCMLPLYPGLITFLAGSGSASGTRQSGAARWLGLAVLEGVLSLMLVVGGLLYRFQASFGNVLTVLLPATYGIVAVFGLAMLAGRNPFARLGSLQTPTMRNPLGTAYVYGLLLAPMTLPCVGPVVLSAFLLGSGSTGSLVRSLLYFLAFGLGFGWPLVVLPFLAQPIQRRFTGTLSQYHRPLSMTSGALLVLIAVFGIVVEVIPSLR